MIVIKITKIGETNITSFSIIYVRCTELLVIFTLLNLQFYSEVYQCQKVKLKTAI